MVVRSVKSFPCRREELSLIPQNRWLKTKQKSKTKTKQKPGVSWGEGSTDEALDRQAGEPEFRSPESTQATYANTHL